MAKNLKYLSNIDKFYFIAAFVMAIIYLVFPYDLLPEADFGNFFVLGFVDDILIVLLLIMFTANTYRNSVSVELME